MSRKLHFDLADEMEPVRWWVIWLFAAGALVGILSVGAVALYLCNWLADRLVGL